MSHKGAQLVGDSLMSRMLLARRVDDTIGAVDWASMGIC